MIVAEARACLIIRGGPRPRPVSYTYVAPSQYKSHLLLLQLFLETRKGKTDETEPIVRLKTVLLVRDNITCMACVYKWRRFKENPIGTSIYHI